MGEVASLGMFGAGFVGGAVSSVFSEYTDVKIYDKDPRRCLNSFDETINQEILIVALPTPTSSDGVVDPSILDEALFHINSNLDSEKPVIIKSTIPPEHLHRWQQTLDKCLIVMHPEFLTERLARLDLQQSNRLIFGTTNREKIDSVERLFAFRFPQVAQYWVTYEIASYCKYITNCFFATKISFFNEIYQLCQACNISYDELIGLVLLDTRIGRSHFRAPGPDGQLGYGLSCLPKDTQGFINILREKNIVSKMVQAAWEKNLEVRPSIWDELKAMGGRAFSSKELWRDIPDFTDYMVSDTGKIKSKSRKSWNGQAWFELEGKLMKPHPNRRGYLSIKLRRDKETHTKEVHRLVLKAFKGEPPKRNTQARHLDGNKINNSVSNLEWGTVTKNIEDKKIHGRNNDGERNGQAKLTPTDVREIKAAYGSLLTELSKKYNAGEANINLILRSKAWRHLVD